MKRLELFLSFLIAFASVGAEEGKVLSFSHESGVFREDISLAIDALEPEVRTYISFIGSEEELAQDNPAWVLYRAPLRLSALPGEERFYLIRVKATLPAAPRAIATLSQGNSTANGNGPANGLASQPSSRLGDASENSSPGRERDAGSEAEAGGDRSGDPDGTAVEATRGSNGDTVLLELNLPYLIDRRAPLAPRIDLPPGEYRQDVQFSFHSEEDVYYVVNGNLARDAVAWDGKPVFLTLDGKEVRYYLVQAVARDKAGNSSRVASYNFALRPANPERAAPLLRILSPASGRFANYQMLYIQARNCRWVKYTLDGSDPLDHGRVYTRPENLIHTGNLRVVVAALANSGEILRKTVSCHVNQESPLKVVSDVQNGLYDHDLKIGLYSKEDADLYYTFSERPPESFDLIYDQGIDVDTIPNTVKYAVLRIRGRDPVYGWAGEYRFFFALDGRESQQEKNGPGAEVSPPVDDVLRVHTDATGPSSKAVAIKAESEKGRPVVYEIGFNTVPPDPAALSPRVEGELLLGVPYGMEAVFYLKLASVDDEGRLTHAQGVTKVEFDRKPPVPPRFSFPHGQESYDTGIKLLLSGEGTFEYEVTDNGTIPSDPTEGSPKYERVIDLPGVPGSAVDYYLKIRASDDLGNTSVPFGPFLFRIDLRPPRVPSIAGVRDGGVYNRDIVALSFEQSNVHIRDRRVAGRPKPVCCNVRLQRSR